jgi:hypothetical protein
MDMYITIMMSALLYCTTMVNHALKVAYQKDACFNNWIRSYKLNRGRNFFVNDKYDLASVSKNPTGVNFMTHCKVSEIRPGLLKLEGDGFTMNMSYNAR